MRPLYEESQLQMLIDWPLQTHVPNEWPSGEDHNSAFVPSNPTKPCCIQVDFGINHN